jgi:hypothetical protein
MTYYVRFQGSHSGEDTGVGLFLVTPCRLVGRYQCFGEIKSQSSTLKMEMVFFSEKLV